MSTTYTTERKNLIADPASKPTGSTRMLYNVNIPIISFNVGTIIICGWAMSPSVQDRLSTDGEGMIWPMLMLISAALSLIHTTVVVVLTALHVRVPPLARILPNCIILIPFLIATVVMLANELGFRSGGGLCGSLGGPDMSPEDYRRECDKLWRRLTSGEAIAVAFGGTVIILSVIEVFYAIRLHRAGIRARKVTSAA